MVDILHFLAGLTLLAGGGDLFVRAPRGWRSRSASRRWWSG
jgi:hypothetical protein